MSSFQHSPLPEGSVRLLRLLPRRDESLRIECCLYNCPLLDSGTGHPFDALSYVWGSGDRHKTILINDLEYPIGANLHAALLHLRDGFVDRTMWVDALCIDQENKDEKSRQVQSMAKIYAKASRVIVWLGEAAATSDRALEDIRMSSSLQSPRLDKADKDAILELLRRPWFQRIWVLQEVAAARHVLVKCGHAELDGYVFGSGLDELKPFYDHEPDLRGLIPPITFLIRNAVFRPGYSSMHVQSGRFSLSIRPLAELVDMFHTRQATVLLDKVYALLGMASDDPSAAGLSADYGASWGTVVRKLVISSISDRISVETWDREEAAVISGKGCVLGEVAVVEGDTITWRDSPGGWSHSLTLPASAQPIRPRDVICLLQGASRPTIIRLNSDYSTVIRIAVPFLHESEFSRAKWTERLESIAFPDRFLLVWDWNNTSQEHALEYGDFRSDRKLPDQATQQQKDLDTAIRWWTMGRVLESAKRDVQANEIFRRSVEIGNTVLSGGRNWASHHARWGAWGELLAQETGVWVPLLYAAEKGYEAVVRLLLDKGAELEVKDREGRTPLMLAAENGHEGAVRRLLSRGAMIEAKDLFSRTPLLHAAENGHDGVVRQLLEKGAAVNAKNGRGWTALLWAATKGHEGVVRQLLDKKGTAVEATDQHGRTPLLRAAENGHERVVRLLLEKGAAVDVKDENGWTPLRWAFQNRHEGVAQQLLRKGAGVTMGDRAVRLLRSLGP